MKLTDKDFLDARGNKYSDKVQLALISSTAALLTGTPAATDKARKDWNALKGADSMAFRDAFQRVKDKIKGEDLPPMVRSGLGTYESASKPTTKEKQVPPTKTAADKVKAHVEGKAAEKKAGMSEETKAKLREAKANKAVKEPKPEIVYSWNKKHEDVGVKVFTGHGTGVIRGWDEGNASYLVYIESIEAEKVVSKKGVHYKAFPEQYREKYTVDKGVRTPSGAFSISTGDEVAQAMNGLSVQQLFDVATRAGMADRFAKWEGRNPGMIRMNLSNCIRAALRDEERAVKTQNALQYAAKLARTYVKPEPKPRATKEAVQETNNAKKVAEATTGTPAKIAGKQNGPKAPVAGTPKKK